MHDVGEHQVQIWCLSSEVHLMTSSLMSAHWLWQTLVLALIISLWPLQTLATTQHRHEEKARDFFDRHGNGNHTNNWAVLVCASRYWFNYRVCLRVSSSC